jgi:hypothetical protein
MVGGGTLVVGDGTLMVGDCTLTADDNTLVCRVTMALRTDHTWENP